MRMTAPGPAALTAAWIEPPAWTTKSCRADAPGGELRRRREAVGAAARGRQQQNHDLGAPTHWRLLSRNAFFLETNGPGAFPRGRPLRLAAYGLRLISR